MEKRNRHSRKRYAARDQGEIPYPAEKRCSKCKTIKPSADFCKKRSERDGLRTACKPCEAICSRESYLRNREKRIAASAAWQAKNPEKKKELAKRTYYKNHASRRARGKAAYEANKEATLTESREQYRSDPDRRQAKLVASRAYYKGHSAERVEYQSKYRELHPERYQAWTNTRRIRKKQAEGSCSPQEWQEILDQFGGFCAYCLRHESDCGKLSIDHMTPLSKGGSNDPDNLVPACRSCNSSKNNKNLLEYLAYRVAS